MLENTGMNEWLAMLLLGVVEGITEFLPISSTGHLILANAWMGMSSEKSKAIEVIIQGGAVLAVLWEYRVRLWAMLMDWRHSLLMRNLLVAFLPVMILGPLVHHPIKAWLFNPLVVALALFLGGVAIILVERFMVAKPDFQATTPETADRSPDRARHFDELSQMSFRTALAIGLFQIVAMIPGTSRSASTIIGGLICGLSRKAATEFSFLLALPTLGGACVYESIKSRDLFLTSGYHDILLLAFGMMVSFVVALIAIRWLLKFLQSHSFMGFAIYRMLLAVVVIGVLY
jgi:undecaprenyl-diphosphatase